MAESVTERWDAFLARHKVNQTGVAKRAGISPPMVSAYRSGLSRPNPDTLRRIAEAFGEDYLTLREQLYPAAFEEDPLTASVARTTETGAGRTGGETTTIRLACLSAAATILTGSGVTGQAVTDLAAAFEAWVVRH